MLANAMSTSPLPFTFVEYVGLAGSVVLAAFLSESVREVISRSSSEHAGEHGAVVIAFIVWMTLVWWYTEYKGGGWSVWVFCVALIIFAPFADVIDSLFGSAAQPDASA